MILISACLIGMNCKYDGGNNYRDTLLDLVKSGKAIPICPEQLGGLKTPRYPSEIKTINGKKYVFNKKNEDVTEEFVRGAEEVLKLAKELNVDKVILQSRSPSCGVGKIYSGNFDRELIDGNGITAQMLIDNNIEVIDVEDYINLKR
ncbi:MAG: DUF523 domain-containing protein [Firmicutes bacterium]|nr:DUF523 domain-containing protein [Bacillota bacterium]